MRRKLVVFTRRFRTTYRSHVQGSSIPRPLKMGPSLNVGNYQPTPPNIPEEQLFNLLSSVIYLSSRESTFIDTKYFPRLFVTNRVLLIWKCAVDNRRIFIFSCALRYSQVLQFLYRNAGLICVLDSSILFIRKAHLTLFLLRHRSL
jgi:hypothetical protein